MRLDQLLVTRGLAESRARAKAAIEAGGVTVDGTPAKSGSQTVGANAEIGYVDAHRWVGRGALKLDHALTVWPVAIDGRVVLDVGASTGGFTEVCLDRGAARVFAVDVGFGQMHERVAADPRVVGLERTDARDLTPDLIPEPPSLIVCDASFISLIKVLRRLAGSLGLGGAGDDREPHHRRRRQYRVPAVGQAGLSRQSLHHASRDPPPYKWGGDGLKQAEGR